MKKVKKNQVKILSQILGVLKPEGLHEEVRAVIGRNYIASRTVVRELESSQEDLSKQLITDRFKELNTKEDRTADEEVEFNTLSKSINKTFADVMDPLLDEECELNATPISQSQYDKLMDNPGSLTYGELGFIYELLVDETKAE